MVCFVHSWLRCGPTPSQLGFIGSVVIRTISLNASCCVQLSRGIFGTTPSPAISDHSPMSFGGSDGRDGGAHSGFSDLHNENARSSFPHESPYNAIRSDPPPKDFHDSGMVRPFGYFYRQQEEYPREDVISAVEKREDVISAVEKCMKKHVDTLLQLLDGISGRLSQLESHCDKLERSIGDLQSDMFQGQSEKDTQLDSLEKHLREVRRSVQILRDKQELAETQKELAKLQSVEKESITAQKTDEDVAPSVSESKRHDEAPAMSNQCLALVPHQASADSAPAPLPAVASEQNRLYNGQFMQQPVPAPSAIMQDQYRTDQTYAVHTQRPTSSQGHQSQPLQHQQHYMQPRTHPQIHDQALTQQQPFPQYQQQWRQPSPQQTMQPPQPTGLTQTRPHTPAYPPYPPHHQVDRISETYPGSTPRRLEADSPGYETYSRGSPVPFSTTTKHSGKRAEVIPFGYGPANTASQPPQHNTQHLPRPQGTQTSNSGYNVSLPYPPHKSEQVHSTMYRDMDGSRSAQSQNFQPVNYLPSNSPAQQNQQLPTRNMLREYVHPYTEMIEKAVGMGYSRDQVANVIHQMGASGQPFDFNVLCGRLNSLTVGASQRGWSG